MRETSARHRGTRQALLQAALTCAERWRWPVVPGAVMVARETGAGLPEVSCECADPACAVPGAHPHDHSLLAATTEVGMVRWWWERHSPQAPVLVATGRAVAAVSLPASAGARALEYLDTLRTPTGPVLATPSRYTLLVAPYGYQELAELLAAEEESLLPGGGPGLVPSSVRYHGPGGYLVLPPSRTGGGTVRWVRRPVALPGGECGCPRWRSCWGRWSRPGRRRRTEVGWRTDDPYPTGPKHGRPRKWKIRPLATGMHQRPDCLNSNKDWRHSQFPRTARRPGIRGGRAECDRSHSERRESITLRQERSVERDLTVHQIRAGLPLLDGELGRRGKHGGQPLGERGRGLLAVGGRHLQREVPDRDHQPVRAE